MMATVGEQLIERGRLEGEHYGQRKALLKVLRARFGALPEAVLARVGAAEVPQVEKWLDRVGIAATLAEVLGEACSHSAQ
jgi:hypothetical protein